jgi:arsenate reductase
MIEKSSSNQNVFDYLTRAKSEIESLSTDRKEKLNKLVDYIQFNKDKEIVSKLIFICTHNSRRSHLSQIWSKVAAEYFGLGNWIEEFSGGTEATAFNPRAVAAIERTGLKVVNPGGENPLYEIFYSEEKKPILCFSKRYDDAFNPQINFAAVMTCNHADQNCPIIPGVEKRISLPYVDPKISDGTAVEAATYDERCLQIAVEQLYIFSKIK